MKIKKLKKNTFGEWLAECPVCKAQILMRGLTMHIKGRVRGELWNKEFGSKKKTPHLDFVKKNAEIIPKETEFVIAIKL